MKGASPDRAVTPLLPAFSPRQSLREEIVDALRAALVAGEMRPGVIYSAPALAEQFGVSATPVREAMLDLVKEGLVQTVRNKGFRVRELSADELDEITRLRMLIEVPTAGDVARRADAESRRALEKLRLAAHAIVRLAEQGDLIQYVEADRRFHLDLLALGGNRQLVDVVRDLRARSRLYGLRELAQKGQLSRSAHEHEELIDLLLSGDVSGATDLMRRHIGHVRGEWAAGALEVEST